MLIVEGPDNVGKTTFCKKVLKKMANSWFPVYYNHMSRPHANFNFKSDYEHMITPFAIQDRFHIGGNVYHNKVTGSDRTQIESWLHGVGSVTVIIVPDASCLSAYEHRLKEAKDRDEMYKVSAIMSHCRRFIEITQKREFQYDLEIKVGFYDSKTPDYANDQAVDLVVNVWENRLAALYKRGQR